MPIPDPLRKELERLSIELVETPHSPLLTAGVPQGLPNSLQPGGWVICPGLFESEDSPELALRDLDHRLHQAKLHSVSVSVVAKTQSHGARFVKGMTRAKAVGFGYKLRHWAVFEITSQRYLVVYTGHNSRSR